MTLEQIGKILLHMQQHDQKRDELLLKLDKRMDNLEVNFAEMKADFEEIKAEFAEMKADFEVIKADFAGIKVEFAEIKEKFSELSEETRRISGCVAVIEQVHGDKIQAIYEGFKGNLSKFDSVEKRFLSNEERLDNHTFRIINLESQVANQ